MNVLVLYSEDKKGDLLSLGTLLYEKNITFKALPLPEEWSIFDSEDLLFHLRNYTHSLFLVSREHIQNRYFIFAVAYCLGAHEKTYLLDTEGGVYPSFWQNRCSLSRSFGEFIQLLWTEKERWERFLKRLEAKDALVERGVEVSNSGFLEAVTAGDTGSVDLYLEAGFSPDLRNKKGVPALVCAIRNSHFLTMRTLLDHGAALDLKASDRDTTALMDAASLGEAAAVQELVERGAQLDQQSKDGQTALILALGKGDDQCALILLQAGANPDIEDKLGMTARKYAQLFGRSKILAYLG